MLPAADSAPPPCLACEPVQRAGGAAATTNQHLSAAATAPPLCAHAGQGSVTVPGCLAATPVEAPISLEEGFPTQARRFQLLAQ
jgi:hypothetical protein